MVKKASLKNILYEPQNVIKKQEVRSQNLTSVQSGWRRRAVSEYIYNVYFNILYNLFVAPLAFK